MIPDPIPVADITSGNDRFVCLPYSSEKVKLKLWARDCVKRQAAVKAGTNGEFWKCRDCQLGQEVHRRAGVTVTIDAEAIAKERRSHWVRGGLNGSRGLRRKRAAIEEDVVIGQDVEEPDEPTVPTLGHTLPNPIGRPEQDVDQPKRTGGWTPEKRAAHSRRLKQIHAEQRESRARAGERVAEPYREKSFPIGDGRRQSDLDGREIITIEPPLAAVPQERSRALEQMRGIDMKPKQLQSPAKKTASKCFHTSLYPEELGFLVAAAGGREKLPIFLREAALEVAARKLGKPAPRIDHKQGGPNTPIVMAARKLGISAAEFRKRAVAEALKRVAS